MGSATVAGMILGPDTHANRPAANEAGLPIGSVYYCSDHDLIYQTDGTNWATWLDNAAPTGVVGSKSGIGVIFDTPEVASQHWVEVPFSGTITGVTLLADVSGSIVIDIWKDTYANYPPTDADSITASAVPTITTATKSQDTTLTGWTTALSEGDILLFNVDSFTTVAKVMAMLTVDRT